MRNQPPAGVLRKYAAARGIWRDALRRDRRRAWSLRMRDHLLNGHDAPSSNLYFCFPISTVPVTSSYFALEALTSFAVVRIFIRSETLGVSGAVVAIVR